MTIVVYMKIHSEKRNMTVVVYMKIHSEKRNMTIVVYMKIHSEKKKLNHALFPKITLLSNQGIFTTLHVNNIEDRQSDENVHM